MFIDIEALPLDLTRNPQADCCFHKRANESASYDGQRDRYHDCFELLDPERVTNNSCQAVLCRWIE